MFIRHEVCWVEVAKVDLTDVPTEGSSDQLYYFPKESFNLLSERTDLREDMYWQPFDVN